MHHKERIVRPHGHGDCESCKKLIVEIGKLRRLIMASKAEVLQAIADEKAQVLAAVEEFNKQIQELKDQLANGVPVTAADLDEIVSAVHDIFIPVA